MTFSEVPPPPLPTRRLSRQVASFPLAHPLMVIYLAGKGFAFSPAGWATGREQRARRRRAKERENRQQKKGKKRIYIIRVGLPRRHRLSPTLTDAMEAKLLATDTEGREKIITCQYLFPLAGLDRNRYITFSWSFPPEDNSRALPLFGIKKTSGVAREKADVARW